MSYIHASELPKGWEIIPDDKKKFFEFELVNELCSEHILFQKDVQVLARKSDRDDFLFLIDGLEKTLCVVHLTWSKETNPNWPSTTQFKDKEEFLKSWNEELYE